MIRFALGAVVLLIAGCAGWQTDYEIPTVNVTSIRTMPGQGVTPRFQIGLHILNPNRTALDLVGISYTVSLAGNEIIKGVANDLPVIEAYGEGEVMLNASASLFNSIRFLTQLMQERRDVLDYEFDAKLDFGGFSRAVHVRQAGELSLGGQNLDTYFDATLDARN